MKKLVFLMACSALLLVHMQCSMNARSSAASGGEDSFTQFVDPFIGTGGHGHVFIGANVPFGFVQLGPSQQTQGWDWCSGYHYSDSVLVGFGHTHLSGTGVGDLGDITFLPVARADQRTDKFTHELETAEPGYYSVHTQEADVQVELTATARTGFHRYFYPDNEPQMLVINLKHGIGWDSMKECGLQQQGDRTVEGYRHSSGWAPDQKLFFVAEFNKPLTALEQEGDSISVLTFEAGSEPLMAKVGLSAVSVENARLNLQTENPGWDFDEVWMKANTQWNEQLGKIRVDMDEEASIIFYTSLFHTMTAPSLFNDVNGDYRGADGKVYQKADFTNYTTFSLWDTYRAAHPLATLIHPDKQRDFAMTFLKICEQQDRLPVWHLVGNETDCMVGNPAIPVLADIVLKGFSVDGKAALEAMKQTAMVDGRSIGLLKKYGYIPWDKEPTNETVSKGLEYALADGALARVAKQLGDSVAYDYFYNRSLSYKKYFDPQTKFMRGLSSDGKFHEPFSPIEAIPGKQDYTEGNAWQYVWLVPHDVYGLIDLFGSEQAFAQKLDSLFTMDSYLGENAASDVTGLIGQYAHGNEPSHHTIYLYNYVGQPWKAAQRLREVMSTLYRVDPDGLCGNEDVGQMSAWYVLSALGLYQVEPAGGRYVFGSPIVNDADVRMGDKTLHIIAHNNSPENIYIQSVRWNGQPYSKSYIDFKDLQQGGTLEFEMGAYPSDTFGVNPDDRP